MTAGRYVSPARFRRHAGFTLVELAVVIAILGLVLGTFLAPLRAQIDAARIREAERTLAEIREALIGYAMTRGALPCPDVVSDGIDGVAPAACAGTALAGILPYQTLGVPRADPWGRLYGYRVTQEFSHRLLTCSSTRILSVWTDLLLFSIRTVFVGAVLTPFDPVFNVRISGPLARYSDSSDQASWACEEASCSFAAVAS